MSYSTLASFLHLPEPLRTSLDVWSRTAPDLGSILVVANLGAYIVALEKRIEALERKVR